MNLSPDQYRLFDIVLFPRNDWAILVHKMSIHLQYDLRSRTCVVVGLDEGGSFREVRLPDTMARSVDLHIREDPFSLHLLFLSEVIRDWTLSFEALQKEINAEVLYT